MPNSEQGDQVEIDHNAKALKLKHTFLVHNLHSGLSTHGQILPVVMFAWKTVVEMAENRDLDRGPTNITNSGSLEMVGLSTLILERLQLTLVFTHGQLCLKP